MLRDLMVNEIVGVDATYNADADLITGMGVIKDPVNKLAKLPSAETGTDILFAQQVPVPKGINAARTIFSDYEDDFMNIAKGAKLVLYNYAYDNILGTDQYDETSLKAGNEDKYVAWGTDGKAKIASAGVQSNYKFLGLVKDNYHMLARIYKTEVPGTNS